MGSVITLILKAIIMKLKKAATMRSILNIY